MIRVKICGITQADDALLACKLGADAIGFIFYEKSPRSVTIQQAASIASQLPQHVARVGVFVDKTPEEIRRHVETVGLTAMQFHGNYSRAALKRFSQEQVIAVARVGESFCTQDLEKIHKAVSAILLDTHKKGLYGGTGETFDWQSAIEAKAYARIILAGGLNPENIRDAAETVEPYALDVSSGVEAEPGRKDHAKLRRLFENLQSLRKDWSSGATCPFPVR